MHDLNAACLYSAIHTVMGKSSSIGIVFFFNDTASTEIYTLSLHDALPICVEVAAEWPVFGAIAVALAANYVPDRKSTRLNSSHPSISYAVFCLKKKKHYGFLQGVQC